VVVRLDDDRLSVTFDESQRAIASGQSLVLYDGDVVLGGGVIGS
jgi:tRNA-specific 2-thiouridylase